MNFLGKVPSISDMYHHPDKGQILTTTEASRFTACQSLRKRSRESEDTQIVHALKLIMMLVWQISWIIVDLLALIVVHNWLTVVTSGDWIS